MPRHAAILPENAQRALLKCFKENRTAAFTSAYIRDETRVEITPRTTARRLRELKLEPHAKTRKVLSIFVDVVVEKLQSAKGRKLLATLGLDGRTAGRAHKV